MRLPHLVAAAAVVLSLSWLMHAPQASAQSVGVVAVVNDIPITEHDITQRIALMKIMGDGGPSLDRKAALKSLIDEQVKITEAKRFNMMPTDAEIKDQVERVANGMGTDRADLQARLKQQGISKATFNRYVGTLIGFNRIISGKYRDEVKVTEAEVDAKMSEIKGKASAQIAKIMNDPRMKAVTVFSLLPINLPLDSDDPMLLQSRAVEASQVARRFKGCGNAKAAAEGVFNVKIGKPFDADAAKLPPQLRDALLKVGTGRAVGPMRGKNSIELIALCGTRKLTPPKPDFKMPTRDQVRRSLLNQKYDGLEEGYLKTIRGNVYVEYRNNDYTQ
jgi:peptidyl-prolyl cis-trans isomerase SurA